MNFTAVVAIVGTVTACCAAGAALWGLHYAKQQIDTAVRDRQVDRVLALHFAFTTGEVGEARNRFGELMYRVGEEAFGPRKCWRPDWESLIPPNPGVAENVSTVRFLGAYPSDMPHAQGSRPIHDLRKVLWCFDRMNEARKREASIDEQLLVTLMGHAVTWYRLLCGRLESKEGAQLYSLVELAEWMEERGWRSDARNKHWKVPENDFPGGEEAVQISKLYNSMKTSSSRRTNAIGSSHSKRSTAAAK
jgi:hypothetical protein